MTPAELLTGRMHKETVLDEQGSQPVGLHPNVVREPLHGPMSQQRAALVNFGRFDDGTEDPQRF